MIVSIASGKGGVGKTTVASNLAVLAARRGLRTVIVDLDIGGADVHIVLGELSPKHTLTDFLERRVERLEDAAISCAAEHRLRLIPGTGETLKTANLSWAAKQRLGRHLSKLDADLTILDIGAGASLHTLDFFLLGERRLVVSTPEPTSIMDAYKFVKLASVRHVLKEFVSRDAVSIELSQRNFRSVEEILKTATEVDAEARDVVAAALNDFAVSLIVNNITPASRLNVARLAGVMREFVGGRFDLLGMLPVDPAVPTAVTRCRPVLVDAPASPFSRSLAALLEKLDVEVGRSRVQSA